jgi:nitrous oxidase accessory protein NosD
VRYCIFRQADSAIHSREAKVEVAKSLFERNLVGIRFHSSPIWITDNLLRDNDTGIRFHFGAPTVSRNRFEGNRVNLFVTAHPSKYQFEDNSFGTPREYQVVLGEEVPEDVRLGGNAWDNPKAEVVLERIFDGRRSPHLGKVEIEPLRDVPLETVGPTWIR